MAWESIRDWLALASMGATAIFTGLLFRYAAKSLTPRYELNVRTWGAKGFHADLEIENNSLSTITLTEVSVRNPRVMFFAKPSDATNYDPSTGTATLSKVGDRRIILHEPIRPKQKFQQDFRFYLPECSSWPDSVSVEVKISINRAVMRHKKKVISAMLTEKIRKATD